MTQSTRRFLTLLLCMVTLLCLAPAAAADEVTMPEQVTLVTDNNTYLHIDVPVSTFDAPAVAAIPGAPKNLKLNSARAWSEGSYYPTGTVTKYGSLSWNATEPFANNADNVTWFHVKAYKNGDLNVWHTVGWDYNYLSNSTLVDFDLSPLVDWETGSYYFTVQAVSEPWNETGSAVVKSSTWKYTAPSAKLPTPTGLKWDGFPYVTWNHIPDYQNNYEISYYVQMQRYYPEDGEWYNFHSQWYIYDNHNAPPDFVLEEGLPYGKYRVRVRAVSDNITVTRNSDWSDYVTYNYTETKLDAPTLSASNVASTGKVKLTWNAVDGAAKYQVYRATSKNGSYSLLKTTTGTSFTNTSGVAGTTYYYKVRAVDANGNKSDFSAVKARACDLAKPVISSIGNEASSGKIRISWDAVENATGYEVYRSTSSSGSYSLVKTTGNTSYTDSSSVAEKTYYYKIKAVCDNESATSALSSYKYRTCDLARPVIKLGNVASTGKVKISWDPIDGAEKYSVYRSTSKDGEYTKLITTSGTSVTNTSTVAGTTYYYKVFAVSSVSAANSAYSSVASRTCDLPRPSITLSVNSKGQPVIQWQAIEGATKYQVYRATSQNGEYTKLITTSGTKVTNSSATFGTTYYYKVKAICSNSAGNSAYSSVKSIVIG